VCVEQGKRFGSCRNEFWGQGELISGRVWCNLPTTWSACWCSTASTVEGNWYWIPPAVRQRSECKGWPRTSTVCLEV